MPVERHELIATVRGKEDAFEVATSFKTSEKQLALQASLSVRQVKN